jgi:hypothetical protein
VVYPEGFFCTTYDEAVNEVASAARNLGKPILAGVSAEGFEIAAFVNPSPNSGETITHRYVKHSSAPFLASEIKGYLGRKDPMFKPIVLGDHRLGVMVCHDMFYGLIPDIYMERSVTCLFDLTGGDVRLNKWKTIVQARSIEFGGPFLCTMANSGDRSGKAAAIAYYDGAALEPVYERLRDDGTGGFAVYELSNRISDQPIQVHQSFSNQQYRDIRVSLDGQGAADINVTHHVSQVSVAGKSLQGKIKQWHSFELHAGRTGVLALPLEAIFSPRRLHELRPPDGTFDHHIVVYHSQKPPKDVDRVLAMARLRAIEHRIAACVLAGTMREAIKTNNYKYIQRFHDTNGVFGLDAKNLGGTRAGCVAGIPENKIDGYLALC